jgi:CheY-like chemotaxis protein
VAQPTPVLVIAGSVERLALLEAALARAAPPALLVLDLELPDLPGSTVLDELAADARTRGIPVLTLGPAATAPLAAHLIARGVQAHLPEPLDVSRLLTLVHALLPRSQRVPRAYGRMPARRDGAPVPVMSHRRAASPALRGNLRRRTPARPTDGGAAAAHAERGSSYAPAQQAVRNGEPTLLPAATAWLLKPTAPARPSPTSNVRTGRRQLEETAGEGAPARQG